METKLFARTRPFLSRSHFESLLSGIRSGSFARRLQWFGRNRRKCSIESDPRIRSETDHLARSQSGERPAIAWPKACARPARPLTRVALPPFPCNDAAVTHGIAFRAA